MDDTREIMWIKKYIKLRPKNHEINNKILRMWLNDGDITLRLLYSSNNFMLSIILSKWIFYAALRWTKAQSDWNQIKSAFKKRKQRDHINQWKIIKSSLTKQSRDMKNNIILSLVTL